LPNWFHLSPVAFALSQTDDPERLLQQWQPEQCELPELAERVVCTLRFLVKKHQFSYAFVRYDEDLCNTTIKPWAGILTVSQFFKHEDAMTKHQSILNTKKEKLEKTL
jgi:hypothetical protein